MTTDDERRYRLTCPVCPFETEVTGDWRAALDAADDHADACGALEEGRTVTVELVQPAERADGGE